MKKSDFAKIVTFNNTDYPENNLFTLYQIFMAEKGDNFDLTLASVEDYLRGLPSCLSYPFYNSDILEKTGLNPDAYWKKLAAYVYDLINKSEADLVGIISDIKRVDTSYYGNPRYSFILDTGTEQLRLQTEPNASLGYSVQNYDNKKVIVSTRFYRGKHTATHCEII